MKVGPYERIGNDEFYLLVGDVTRVWSQLERELLSLGMMFMGLTNPSLTTVVGNLAGVTNAIEFFARAGASSVPDHSQKHISEFTRRAGDLQREYNQLRLGMFFVSEDGIGNLHFSVREDVPWPNSKIVELRDAIRQLDMDLMLFAVSIGHGTIITGEPSPPDAGRLQ